MSVRVEIVPRPLDAAAPDTRADAGAVVQFEGVVRPIEDGRPLLALEYEAYRPMADNMLRELARQVLEEHGLTAITVEHSTGTVHVGERSFRLVVASPHRAQALSAMASFIDRMKQDVPIWKRPVFAVVEEGST
ncbi:MAG: molybdenum cofactor biosynthesis protein MoaE [Phycisphaeraceae bacterium]|nr:molybdenum cofactor biosynthesis protein MoaE [Phycisphaeraceae bacterium]